MSTECCICTRPDDLECPSCDKLFCISCFVDHGKSCYEEMKKKAEQKRCSVCGRYASINPTVHCSDCQIEICRSCLYAHRKTHEEEKAKANWRYCVQCGLSKIASNFHVCSICHGPVCNTCKEAHKQAHTKSYARCSGCGERTTTECDECKQPYCFPCFAKHRAVHEQSSYTKYRCSGCNRIKTQDPNKSGSPFWQCPQCQEYYCEACTMTHTHVYARANFAGRFNPNDFKINSDIINETIKQAKETAERIRQEAEAKRKQEEEARREQMKHANDAFWQNMFSGRSSFWGKDEPEETDAYKAHYTGQQSQNHSQYSRQQTRTSAPSQELVAAFKLLQLSTRATVQEVKRARNRLAKQGEYRHPDVGGTQEAFIKLNNAYELALSHAERNER